MSERRAAVIGYGHQGEAQALNLRDAGWEVAVGARAGGSAETRARAAGFETLAPAAAAARAPIVALLLPDEVLPEVWGELAAAFVPRATLVFAHGFNLLYGELGLPDNADVVLVSPTAPGRELRARRQRGETLPAYVAVERDASGTARATAERYAAAIGCGPLWSTTVREETEVDLFGEQAVLCGGMNALVTAAFDTLVEAGYTPEIAYLECVHQLAYLAALLNERGVAGLRRSISGTALYGDLTRGERIVGEASRAAMKTALAQIRDGSFAREWRAEAAAGRPRLTRELEQRAGHPIELARRRALGREGEPGRA